jgi:hypothetical protein
LTCLRGIAGVSVDKITADELKGFCAAQKISGYKGATKAKMCDLIANQYKNQHMYDGLGRKGMGSDQSNNKRKTTTDKKRSKYLVPMAVTKTGTYYRAINCFFADSTRVHVRALTSTVSKNEMDQGLFAHQRVYEHLLSIYLDKDDLDIRKLQTTDVVFAGIDPGNYDVLTVGELKQLLDFVARGYNRVNRSLSGDHRAFLDRSGEQIYLHYYNILVQENDEVKQIVDVTLGDGFGESGVLIDDVDTVSPKSTSTNKATKKGKTAEAVEKVLVTISESLGLRTKYQEDKLAVAKEKLLQSKRIVELQERRKVQDDRRILEEEVQSGLADYMKYQQQLAGGHLVEGTTQYSMVTSMVEYYEDKWRNAMDAVKRLKDPQTSAATP